MENKNNWIVGVLILVNIFICIYIGLSNNSSTDFICKQGSSCDVVRSSIYGTIFGIKVAWFGVISFLIYLIFLVTKLRKLVYLATFAGTGFALYFIFLQIFVLKTICTECMLIDSIMIIVFLITIFWNKNEQTNS